MINNFIKAARLRTLPLSVSGIIVGAGLAISEGNFNAVIFVLALLTTIGFQVISNFANDYGDGIKGTDNEDRVGPKRAIQSGEITPKQMLSATIYTSIVTFVIALILIYVAFEKDDFFNIGIFFVLGILSIAAAIKYTVGNKAYGYSGFGDIFVFVFFGLLSVLGSYYLFSKELNIINLLPAFTIGFLSIGVLNLNNMRDRESDLKSNKRTLVVKIGNEMAKYYHYYLLVASLLFSLLFATITYKSPFQFLFLIAFIPIGKHLVFVFQNNEPKFLDQELKKLALSTFLFSILFLIGFLF